jgi:predicted RNA-binding protein with PUA-like domain
MKLGQFCLFYASNCKTPGITGIAKIVKEGYPDYNAWDEKHP